MGVPGRTIVDLIYPTPDRYTVSRSAPPRSLSRASGQDTSTDNQGQVFAGIEATPQRIHPC